MTIHYPNGTRSSYCAQNSPKIQANTFSNRGMRLEEALNDSNQYYLTHQLAVVHKKPTPIQIVHVEYPKRSAAKIKEAYFTQASTTDYNGVYQGYYLDFEAKETKNKTSFPLKNFHEHQICHFENCLAQSGICFAILWFATLQRCFLLDAHDLITAWRNQTEGRKSIPLKTIEKNGIELTLGIAPRIPYLAGVDKLIRKETHDG